MTSRTAILVLATALFVPTMATLGGCALGNTSIAEENQSTLSQKLVPGKTTKAQVLRQFGEPTEKAIINGRETWTYRMVNTAFRTYVPFVGLAMGNNATETTDVVVTFDRAGVVARHDLLKTKG